MSWYCDAAKGDPHHQPYHNREYGFPQKDDDVLLERLALEIFQAGLSWLTILKKRDAIFQAFGGFKVENVAAYGNQERERLLNDPGIIRNRLKIDAIIENAKRIGAIREEFGSFDAWIAAHHPLKKSQWIKLFKKTFKFTGGEITNEFLMSIGYLPGVHRPDCPTYAEIAKLNPPWMTAGEDFYRED